MSLHQSRRSTRKRTKSSRFRKLPGVRKDRTGCGDPDCGCGGDLDDNEMLARALMVDLFDLQRNHNGIGVMSKAHPRLTYEFRMGGELIVDWMGGSRDMCISTDGYQMFPPTDKAIACAVLAHTNEREFIDKVGVQHYVPADGARYIVNFLNSPILEIEPYDPGPNLALS